MKQYKTAAAFECRNLRKSIKISNQLRHASLVKEAKELEATFKLGAEVKVISGKYTGLTGRIVYTCFSAYDQEVKVRFETGNRYEWEYYYTIDDLSIIEAKAVNGL